MSEHLHECGYCGKFWREKQGNTMALQTPRRFNAQGAAIAIGISAWCWYGLYLAVLTVLSR
jgi:hypothetical protein